MPRKLAKGDASQPAAGSDAVVKAEIAKGEGPMTDAEKAQPAVTLAVSKRLRAARKRLTKIEAISSAEKEGKTLNDDQRETLKGKAGVLAIIDELEKITPLLKEAAAEEVSKGIAAADAKAKARAERRAERERAEKETAGEGGDGDKDVGPSMPPQEGAQDAANEAPAPDASATAQDASDSVDRLLSLLYFSQLFSGSSEYVQQAERTSCISYDQYSNEEGLLTEADLDLIAKFGGLLLTRHPNKTNSHSEALEECKALARTWLSEPKAGLPDTVATGTTVEELTAKLERIMKSDYFTIQPQIQQMQQEGEDSAPAGGSSEGDYRGLAVSQAEAVLEPPPRPPVVPQQHAGGLDLHSSLQPTGLPDTLSGGDLTSLHQQPPQHQQQQPGQQLPSQFYGSNIYSGAAAYHPGANAAFQAVPPTTQFDPPQMPAINFMNSSSLGMDSGAEPFASAPSQPPQQPQEQPKPADAPQQPQSPQQQQQPQLLGQGQGPPMQQQPQQQQQPAAANGFSRPPQQGGGLNASSDAEVPAPGRGRGDRGGRRGSGRGWGGRGYRGGPPGEGRGEGREGRGDGQGYRGGYRGGPGRGRGPPAPNNGNSAQPPQQQQGQQ